VFLPFFFSVKLVFSPRPPQIETSRQVTMEMLNGNAETIARWNNGTFWRNAETTGEFKARLSIKYPG
jgi:hypothetical protein